MIFKVHGAVIQKKEGNFAIVYVKRTAMHTNYKAVETRIIFQKLFPGMPLVLLSLDAKKEVGYFGRQDLVDYLKTMDVSKIQWREFTFSEQT